MFHGAQRGGRRNRAKREGAVQSMTPKSLLIRSATVMAATTAYYVYRTQLPWDTTDKLRFVGWIPIVLGVVLLVGWYFQSPYDPQWLSARGRKQAWAAIATGAVALAVISWAQDHAMSEWMAISDLCDRGRAADTLAERWHALAESDSRLAAAWWSKPSGVWWCQVLRTELTKLQKAGVCPEFLLKEVPCGCGDHKWLGNTTASECPVPVCFPQLSDEYLNTDGQTPILQCRKQKRPGGEYDRSGVPMMKESDNPDAPPLNCEPVRLCRGGICEMAKVCDPDP
jgi:hypothetical protein